MAHEEGLAEGLTIGHMIGKRKHTHCIKCEAEIPYNAKTCPYCKARQPQTNW